MEKKFLELGTRLTDRLECELPLPPQTKKRANGSETGTLCQTTKMVPGVFSSHNHNIKAVPFRIVARAALGPQAILASVLSLSHIIIKHTRKKHTTARSRLEPSRFVKQQESSSRLCEKLPPSRTRHAHDSSHHHSLATCHI